MPDTISSLLTFYDFAIQSYGAFRGQLGAFPRVHEILIKPMHNFIQIGNGIYT